MQMAAEVGAYVHRLMQQDNPKAARLLLDHIADELFAPLAGEAFQAAVGRVCQLLQATSAGELRSRGLFVVALAAQVTGVVVTLLTTSPATMGGGAAGSPPPAAAELTFAAGGDSDNPYECHMLWGTAATHEFVFTPPRPAASKPVSVSVCAARAMTALTCLVSWKVQPIDLAAIQA